MDWREILKKNLNDVELLNDLEREINNNLNLEEITKLNLKICVTEYGSISHAVVFRELLMSKSKAQHLLNILSNDKYFRSISKHLIIKDNSFIQNGQLLVDEVTKSVLRYVILFHILKDIKDTSFEDNASNVISTITVFPSVNKRQQITENNSVKRRSICTYCDSKISENDLKCPICEALVQGKDIPLISVKNDTLTNNYDDEKEISDLLIVEESFSDDSVDKIKTLNIPANVNLFNDKKFKTKILNADISQKEHLHDVITEGNKVDERLLKNNWLCYYCNYMNDEGVTTCDTCLTSRRKSKESENKNEKLRRDENIMKPLEKDVKYSKEIINKNEVLYKPKFKDNSSINTSNFEYNNFNSKDRLSQSEDNKHKSYEFSFPSKYTSLIKDTANNSSFGAIKEMSDISQKGNRCNWVCTLCSFNNINIAVNFQSCLACFKEGKPNIQSVEHKHTTVSEKIDLNYKYNGNREDLYKISSDRSEEFHINEDRENKYKKSPKNFIENSGLYNKPIALLGSNHNDTSASKKNFTDGSLSSTSFERDASNYKYPKSMGKSGPRKNEENKPLSLLNDPSNDIIKDTSKIIKSQQSNQCSWECTLCSFNNINIGVNCQSCLACFKEGKPKDLNVRNECTKIIEKENVKPKYVKQESLSRSITKLDDSGNLRVDLQNENRGNKNSHLSQVNKQTYDTNDKHINVLIENKSEPCSSTEVIKASSPLQRKVGNIQEKKKNGGQQQSTSPTESKSSSTAFQTNYNEKLKNRKTNKDFSKAGVITQSKNTPGSSNMVESQRCPIKEDQIRLEDDSKEMLSSNINKPNKSGGKYYKFKNRFSFLLFSSPKKRSESPKVCNTCGKKYQQINTMESVKSVYHCQKRIESLQRNEITALCYLSDA